MIGTDRDALICDMAETYHVFDMWSLPLRTVATLASGLREDSRIRKILNGRKIGSDRLLMAGMLDRLSLLVWLWTKDGAKGRNRPASLVKLLLDPGKSESELEGFESEEDFDRRWAEVTGR